MGEGMSEKTPTHQNWVSRAGRNSGSQFQTNMTETRERPAWAAGSRRRGRRQDGESIQGARKDIRGRARGGDRDEEVFPTVEVCDGLRIGVVGCQPHADRLGLIVVSLD